MAKPTCGATLTLYGETYHCDRKPGHTKRWHRERMYGCDDRGQYHSIVKWSRWRDRRA